MRILLCVAAIGVVPFFALRAGSTAEPVRKPYGIETRQLWTTSKVKGSPEPPDPYTMKRVYPKLKFNEALEIAAVPGKKAWGIAERPGKIYTFDATAAKPEKKLALDVKHTVYGFAFHPKFQTNGFIYLSEVPDASKGTTPTAATQRRMRTGGNSVETGKRNRRSIADGKTMCDRPRSPFRAKRGPRWDHPALVPTARKSSIARATASGSTFFSRRPRRISAQFFRMCSACRLPLRAKYWCSSGCIHS